MPQIDQPKIKISAIHQIGIVVRNLQEVAENYWKMLGIGPWEIVTQRHIPEATYHGEPAHFETKVAFAKVGGVELELLETLKGHTVYTDFLARHGEGIQHVQYTLDSLVEISNHVKFMTKRGFPSLMGGRFGNNGGFSYVDTEKALGTVLEMVKYPDKHTASVVNYPDSATEIGLRQVTVKAITRVNIVVKNLEETMENYWNLIAVGPWDVFECAPPVWHDTTYHGKPTGLTMKAALAMAGPIEIGLIQPVSGDSIYNDFMSERGPGAALLAFKVNNVDEMTKVMEKKGFSCVQYGRVGSDGAYAYYDTLEPLKTLWGVYKPSTAMPVI